MGPMACEVWSGVVLQKKKKNSPLASNEQAQTSTTWAASSHVCEIIN
jgi:hypothetical protein